MNHAASRRTGSKTSPATRRRDDVEAVMALVDLDQDIARAEAATASAEVRERRADLATRRSAFTRRMPPATLEDYETALRLGLSPGAVATRGRVCWGCFHRLSGAVAAELQDAQTFARCPHCERVLFNPDWTERR